MSTEIAIPEHLRKYAASTTTEDAASLASASISIPRISLRGRKFRLIEGGEEIRKPSEELLCVILAVEPGPGLFNKTYYEGVYQSGDSAPPSCASSDGIAPDPWVSAPQAPKCAGCPKNIFGSATSRSGKKAKACRDSKRLWVALPDNVEGTVFALGVPVTSLKAVSELGREIQKYGIPLSAAVIKITMEDTEFPQLLFEVSEFLPEKMFHTALERSTTRNWDIGSARSAPQIEGPGQATTAQSQLEKSKQIGVETLGTGDAAPAPAPIAGESVDKVVGEW